MGRVVRTAGLGSDEYVSTYVSLVELSLHPPSRAKARKQFQQELRGISSLFLRGKIHEYLESSFLTSRRREKTEPHVPMVTIPPF